MTRFIVVAAALGLGACAGDLQNPDRFQDAAVGVPPAPTPTPDPPTPTPDPPTPTPDPPALPEPPTCFQDLMENKCGMSGCHSAGAPFDLVSPMPGERLLDQPALEGPCEGEVYITSDSGTSLLLDKVMETPSCGSPMPLVGDPLTTDEVACIDDYVTSVQEAAQ